MHGATPDGSIRSPSRSSATRSSSIVEEMGETLVRAAYSTNIKERRDSSTCLFDAQGRTLCQADAHPDAPRLAHGRRRARDRAASARRRSARATSSSATTPTPAAARICPTSCWSSRSSSTDAGRRVGDQHRAPRRLRRPRPRAHLPGRPAHPAGAALSRGRAAAGRARPDPAELPGAARAPQRSARADGGEPAGHPALPVALPTLRHGARAGGERARCSTTRSA